MQRRGWVHISLLCRHPGRSTLRVSTHPQTSWSSPFRRGLNDGSQDEMHYANFSLQWRCPRHFSDSATVVCVDGCERSSERARIRSFHVCGRPNPSIIIVLARSSDSPGRRFVKFSFRASTCAPLEAGARAKGCTRSTRRVHCFIDSRIDAHIRFFVRKFRLLDRDTYLRRLSRRAECRLQFPRLSRCTLRDVQKFRWQSTHIGIPNEVVEMSAKAEYETLVPSLICTIVQMYVQDYALVEIRRFYHNGTRNIVTLLSKALPKFTSNNGFNRTRPR